jgi:hypothetical protein
MGILTTRTLPVQKASNFLLSELALNLFGSEKRANDFKSRVAI